MSFPFNVYLLALVSSCVATALTMPRWQLWCQRVGLVDEPGGRKIHLSPTPLAGGLALLTGLAVPLLCGTLVLKFNLFGMESNATLLHGLHRRATELFAIAAGAVGMVALGVCDDKYELRPALKFAGQFLIALLVAAAGVRVTLFVPSAVFSYAITILWILTVTNALNFTDNMNGLCAGLGLIGSWYFAVVAAVAGQYLVALLAFLVCGTLLGFLPYNFPKAGAFLGDAGSHLVGYLLAVLAILPHFFTPENQRPLAVLTPLLILAVPLGDLVWVVLLRLRTGKPFYVGDTNHLSHRLVQRGLTPTCAVLLIWLIATVLGAVVAI